jgi:uncharacterized protein YutE (UPF0331/DUF86 family)
MPIDKDGIKIKLRQLEEYISDVKQLRSKPETEFVERSDTEVLAERHIEKACQASLDIANHIVAETGLGAPTMYRDLGYILAKANIITDDMAKKIENIAKFRNRLVHEYAHLDPSVIYQIVQTNIDDLVEFAKQIYQYMEK